MQDDGVETHAGRTDTSEGVLGRRAQVMHDLAKLVDVIAQPIPQKTCTRKEQMILLSTLKHWLAA
jgi:hypothetical protein